MIDIDKNVLFKLGPDNRLRMFVSKKDNFRIMHTFHSREEVTLELRSQVCQQEGVRIMHTFHSREKGGHVGVESIGVSARRRG